MQSPKALAKKLSDVETLQEHVCLLLYCKQLGTRNSDSNEGYISLLSSYINSILNISKKEERELCFCFLVVKLLQVIATNVRGIRMS
jgi:hypothetical protein